LRERAVEFGRFGQDRNDGSAAGCIGLQLAGRIEIRIGQAALCRGAQFQFGDQIEAG
jgi:hypothetical protein